LKARRATRRAFSFQETVVPNDPFNLARFVDAQAAGYAPALAELRAGRKTSHWIWYVFPQLVGLGISEASRFYGLSGLDEARAYLAHPLLGARLHECVSTLLDGDARSAQEVLGEMDAMKLRSSLTLFSRAAPEDPIFGRALDLFFPEGPDEHTLARLDS
jgi:uncharacterized protein (DUF1810 family)